MAKRLRKSDWIAHGLHVLETRGHGGLKADLMVADLGVSRGSFYWHFKNVEDFHAQLLEQWKIESLTHSQAFLDDQSKSTTRMIAFLAQMLDQPLELERAMRRWAADTPDAAQVMNDLDAARLSVATTLLADQGVPDAQARAKVMYWAFVGRSVMATEATLSAQEAITLTDLFLTSGAER